MLLKNTSLSLLVILGLLTPTLCIWTEPTDERISEARSEISVDDLKQVSLYKNGTMRERLNFPQNSKLEQFKKDEIELSKI